MDPLDIPWCCSRDMHVKAGGVWVCSECEDETTFEQWENELEDRWQRAQERAAENTP